MFSSLFRLVIIDGRKAELVRMSCTEALADLSHMPEEEDKQEEENKSEEGNKLEEDAGNKPGNKSESLVSIEDRVCQTMDKESSDSSVESDDQTCMSEKPDTSKTDKKLEECKQVETFEGKSEDFDTKTSEIKTAPLDLPEKQTEGEETVINEKDDNQVDKLEEKNETCAKTDTEMIQDDTGQDADNIKETHVALVVRIYFFTVVNVSYFRNHGYYPLHFILQHKGLVICS